VAQQLEEESPCASGVRARLALSTGPEKRGERFQVGHGLGRRAPIEQPKWAKASLLNRCKRGGGQGLHEHQVFDENIGTSRQERAPQ
jgi:hypothetical protein